MKIYMLPLLLLSFIGVTAQTMPTISDAPVGGEWAANTTWYYIKCGTGDYLNDANHYPSTAVLVLTDQNVPTTDQGIWCVVWAARLPASASTTRPTAITWQPRTKASADGLWPE